MSDIPTVDIHKIGYLSKEEIAEKTGLSPHTLQNWINSDKPTDAEFETLRSSKRAYSTMYLKKIFTNANRDDLLPKLRTDESLTAGQVEASQWSGISQVVPDQWLRNDHPEKVYQPAQKVDEPSNNQVIDLINQKWEASVAGKEEVISLLKEQAETTKGQLDLKDMQIADLSRNLNQQQVLQMETVKEVSRLRDENKILLLSTVQPIDDHKKPESSPIPEIRTDKVAEQEPVSKKGLFARIFG